MLIAAIVIIACMVVIEVNSGTPNGGPGHMTPADAAIGVGLRIYMESNK